VGVDSPKIAEYLKEHPEWIKNIPEKQRADVLAECMQRGCIETVEYLIKSCKFNVTDKTSSFGSRVPLEFAFSRKDDFMKSFFNIIDVNQRDDTGRTPLHYALEQGGKISALAVLLFHPKLDLEAKTNDGKSILEFLMQKAPWLEDWRNDKCESLKKDIEKYDPSTKNIKRFSSDILKAEFIENCDIVSALKEVRNLQPSDSVEKKVLGVIKFKYYFDKYFDMETDEAHDVIKRELQTTFLRCISKDRDFQSIHVLAALGLTNKKIKENSSFFENYYDYFTKLAERRRTCDRKSFDALIKYGFVSQSDLNHLLFLAIQNNHHNLQKYVANTELVPGMRAEQTFH